MIAKEFDVVAICNALMDVLIQIPESDFQKLQLRKGAMHLVDHATQQKLLNGIGSFVQTTELGGSSMNATRTLASLGKKTAFAGLVGSDEFGSRIRSRMQALGIGHHLGLSANEPTGSCLILITPDGERTMNTFLGASRLYTPEHIPLQTIRAAKALHFCGYQWDTDGQKAGIAAAIDCAVKADTLVSFDVADPFVVERNREAFQDVIKMSADIVFANREEASLLYDAPPEVAAQKIADTGAIAVVKLGAEGALVRSGNFTHRIAPVPTKVVDTTAAGDMFAAGFLAGHLSGLSLVESGRIAATLASDVISRIGATISPDALQRVVGWLTTGRVT